MNTWDDWRYVLALARAGKAANAANDLGVDPSTVLRRIKNLETELGVQLFQPMGHDYLETDAGRRVVRAAERMAAEVRSVEDWLEIAAPLTGTLRVLMSEDLAAGIFDATIAQFCQHHPNVHLNIIMHGRNASLGQFGADVALQTIFPHKEAGEEGQKVCDVAWSCYASPSYRERESWPEHVEDLSQHVVLVPSDRPRVWRFLKDLRRGIQPRLRSTSLFNLRQMALNGLGIAILPCYVGDPASDLIRLFPPIEALSETLWIVSHRELRRTARVDAFFEFFGDLKADDLARIQVEHLPPRLRTRDQMGGQGILPHLPKG